ncbi:MAG TPA: TonB-dependent receptor [Hyphomonadaceae bacterium]|nr:TonB-dependent receptor [Hyphomonadaceae bacterium]
MRTYLLMAGVSGLSIVFAPHAFGQAEPKPVIAVSTEQPANSASSDRSDVVVVTASRREETVKDVPTAVSAFTGDALAEAQISSLGDLAQLTPNLQISTYSTNANVAIRGIGNSQVGAGADAGVAVHADGVYLGQASLAVSSFLDVNRVEVLRGPQGTLFGRNATGGAINIIPNRPSDTYDHGLNVSTGFDPYFLRSSAYITGPLDLEGQLLGRLSVQQNYNEGYTRNINPGVNGPGRPSSSAPRRLDEVNAAAVRGQLEWRPSSDFRTRLLVEHLSQGDNGPASFVTGTPDPSIPLPVQIQGQPFGDPEKWEAYANQGSRDLKSTTANLVSDVSLGEGNLTVTLSYNTSDNFTNQDGDGTAVQFTNTGYRNKARQYYGELLYASDPAEPFTYILGANVFDEDLRQTVSVPIDGFPAPVNLGGEVTTKSYAAFARGQYEFDWGLKAFAGARYSYDKKALDEYNNYVGVNADEKSWNRLTYEVGISQDFSEALTGYAKYSTGYKGGGFAAGSLSPPVNPETNTNMEIGLKGSYLDDRLTANLAAFRMNYDDLQVSQVIGAASTLSNAAKATVNGFEAEIVVQPTDQLRLNLSGAWLDAKFDEFVTADSSRPSLGVLDLAGNRLPQAPEFSASSGIYYEIPFPQAALTIGARYDWKSTLYFSEFNTPISAQDDVGKLDLNAIYATDDGRWTFSVFALNVTNEQVKSNVLIVSALLGSVAVTQYQPARQIGVSLSHHF